MRRHHPFRLLGVIAITALAFISCGDDSSSEPAATLVTVGDLGLELPITVPQDIPAPSNGAFAGETPAPPWEAIQIGSDFDPETLRTAIAEFGESIGATFDASLGQIVYTTTINGEDKAVYAWVRTTDVGEHSTLLDIGTADPTG